MNPMPPALTSMQSANDFNQFFIDKIKRLKTRFEENSIYGYLDVQKTMPNLTEFQPISLQKVERLILSAPLKTCALDPVPTKIVKSVASTIGPTIQKIINLSLANLWFPQNSRQRSLNLFSKSLT